MYIVYGYKNVLYKSLFDHNNGFRLASIAKSERTLEDLPHLF